MKKVINMLGFKINEFDDWLRKNGKAQIGTKAQNAPGPALLKEPSGSGTSRQHLRVIK